VSVTDEPQIAIEVLGELLRGAQRELGHLAMGEPVQRGPIYAGLGRNIAERAARETAPHLIRKKGCQIDHLSAFY